MEKMSKIEEMQKQYSAYLQKTQTSRLNEPDVLSSDAINMRLNVLNELKNRVAKKLQAIDHQLQASLFFGQVSEFDDNISLLCQIDDSCENLIYFLSKNFKPCSEENQEEEVVED